MQYEERILPDLVTEPQSLEKEAEGETTADASREAQEPETVQEP